MVADWLASVYAGSYAGQFPRFFGSSAKFYDVDAGFDTGDPWARNVALYAGLGLFFSLLTFVVCVTCAVCKLCRHACARCCPCKDTRSQSLVTREGRLYIVGVVATAAVCVASNGLA